jgi:carbon monoxide dehydrogenase subunit G
VSSVTRTVTIGAPVDEVFDTIAHIDSFSEAVPGIKDVEFLSDVRSGVGTMFKETREMNGRTGSTVLEVTEYEANQRIRIVSDTGGTLWDTLFTTRSVPGGTELAMFMEAKPHTVVARITTPMVKGVVARGIESDLRAVKAYCEADDPVPSN